MRTMFCLPIGAPCCSTALLMLSRAMKIAAFMPKWSRFPPASWEPRPIGECTIADPTSGLCREKRSAEMGVDGVAALKGPLTRYVVDLVERKVRRGSNDIHSRE